MIILHNSYALQETAADRVFYNGGSALKLSIWQKGYRYSSRFRGYGPNGSDLTVRVTDAERKQLELYIKQAAVDPIYNLYATILKRKLVGFEKILLEVTKEFGKSEADLSSAKTVPHIFGVAMLRFLVSNRQKNNQYNDFTLGAMLARENVLQRSRTDKRMYCICNGFSPDLDRDYASNYDLAVGMGQRHKAIWHDLGKYLVTPDILTLNDHVANRFALGRLPWWLQAGLICLDIQRAATSYSWLRNPNPPASNPVVIGCKYPYILFGQPALWRKNLDSLKDSSYIKPCEIWAKTVRSDQGAAPIDRQVLTYLKRGIAPDDDVTYLFPGLSDEDWLLAVAGIPNLGRKSSDGTNSKASVNSLPTPDVTVPIPLSTVISRARRFSSPSFIKSGTESDQRRAIFVPSRNSQDAVGIVRRLVVE